MQKNNDKRAKTLLKRLVWFFSTQVGIDCLKMVWFCRRLLIFLQDYLVFRTKYSGKFELLPCLHDRFEQSGNIANEYFWADLYIAQKIFAAAPSRHVDVGSRIDGFVAHVASFREIEVFDIRALENTIPNVSFKVRNFMQKDSSLDKTCDSLSCLHALEHFGLGRYGDKIEPYGYEDGFRNMAAMLQNGGVFYLATPIGEERIEFNGQHVFSPDTILKLAESCDLALIDFVTAADVCGSGSQPVSMVTFSKLKELRYSLGIFTFRKISDNKNQQQARTI